jgi:hypothetical protein
MGVVRDIYVQAPNKVQATKMIRQQMEPGEGILLVGLSRVITEKTEVGGAQRRHFRSPASWVSEDDALERSHLIVDGLAN